MSNRKNGPLVFHIRFIVSDEMEVIIPFLQQLNPDIDYDTLKQRLKDMVAQGYQCIGAYDGERLIGVSGIWILTKYYIGKHIEPDNVFILPEYRSQGVAVLLMEWIFAYAKSIGCQASELNCYIKNDGGQKFWKKQGYEIVAYHFQKKW